MIGTSVVPNKTNTPLVIDSNAVLPRSVGFQKFEPIARRYFQIVQHDSLIEQTQLSQCNGLYIRWKLPASHTVPDKFSFPAIETSDHFYP
jgi:hypothetical protein